MNAHAQDSHLSDAEINRDLLAPLFNTGWKYCVTVTFFGSIALLAFLAWAYQIDRGIGVVGKNRPAFWGFYITSFVFWIGISHAGTLISAILRVVQAEWRRPITRCAEAITAFALFTGSLFPIIHLGRGWLFYWLIPYPNDRYLWPNFRSPLMWDFIAINTYLIGSLLYLYLPMIPDLALVRDKATGMRRSLYRILALGWRGTADEWLRLDKAISIMALLIIPVAVSVHTIVSWDFAMTVLPMWHSTIFGPYFVVGAIFSGIAALLVAMVLVRKLLHLEKYLQPVHFDNLAKLLLTLSLLWFYFTFTEYLTTWYGNEAAEMPVFWSKVSGPYAPLFWAMVGCNFLIPFPILALKRLRTVTGILVSSVLVLIGMWLERFLIIVPTLVHPFLPYNEWYYRPSWVEVTIAAGTFGIFTLFYLLFAKLSPMISVWEVKEGQHTDKAAQTSLRRAQPRADRMDESSIQAIVADLKVLPSVLERLEAAGVRPSQIEMISQVPIRGGVLRKNNSRLGWFALTGALLGALGGFALAALTALAYPIPTGGMPILAWWPIGIVTYETTMLGAILATVLGFLVEARLPHFKPMVYDGAVADGAVLLAISKLDEPSANQCRSILRASGASLSESS